MAQQIRELTPQEIADGQRGITDKKYTATQIQALVRTMDSSKKKWARLKSSNPTEYMKKLKDENEELYFNFPPIFDKHAKDELDATFFEMLALKRKIEKGEITSDQASAIVGQRMFNRFVPHVLSNTAAPPNPMSYEEFYRQH